MNIVIMEGLEREVPLNHREINDYKISKALNTTEPETIRAFVLFSFKYYLMKNKDIAFILRDSSVYLNDINDVLKEFNLKFDKDEILIIKGKNNDSNKDGDSP